MNDKKNQNDSKKAQIDLTKIYGEEYKLPDGLTAEDVAKIIHEMLKEGKLS